MTKLFISSYDHSKSLKSVSQEYGGVLLVMWSRNCKNNSIHEYFTMNWQCKLRNH